MFRHAVWFVASTLLLSTSATATTFEFETLETIGEDITFSASLSLLDDGPFFVEADLNEATFGDFLNPIIDASPNFESFELAYDFIGGSAGLRVTPTDLVFDRTPDFVEIVSFSGDIDGGGSLFYTNTESSALGDATAFLGRWRIEFPSDALLGSPTTTAVIGRFVATPSTVPEPSSLAMLFTAFLTILLVRRRGFSLC